jgi:LysR substrate binding domain.
MFEGRRFVRVSARGGHVYPLQAMIEQGLMPQVALTVAEYATVPAVLEATDLVVLLPRHVAEVFSGWFPGLRIAELPWPGRSTPVALYTRREASLSPAQRWFRSVVLDAVAADEYRPS